MNVRQYYRSRAFWFGVPGLVFLLWGWWLSMGHWSAVGFGEARPWGFAQVGGEVLACWDSSEGPDRGILEAAHREVSLEYVREVKSYLATRRETHPGYRIVFIPYYWLILAYTATWLLTLAWWQRRKSRLLNLHTAP